MKKYSLFLTVLFALVLSCAAFAADGEWTTWEADLSGASAIACELAEPQLENEDVKAILGEVTEDDWSIGPEDAVMTLIEYADFQCPYCSRAGLTALEFQASHPDEVRYVYRHFPLSFHEKAPMSAYAADAAGKQGLFFKAEEFLYETQSDWTNLESLEVFDAWLREHIAEAIPELDFDQWVADYESEEIRAVVDGSFEKVAATGIISGTPTFFANFFQVSYDPAVLEQHVKAFKVMGSYKTECPVLVVEEGKDYRAVLHTTAGDITVDLYANEAPNLVSNFMLLAADGWYDGNLFHNVVPGFIAQTGDPSATGIGLAGYFIDNENLDNGGFDEPGAVAMASNSNGQNSSQFFIAMDLNAYYRTDAANKNPDMPEEELAAKAAEKVGKLNARYSVFGRVTEESLAVLDLIDTSTVIESIDLEVRG